MPSIKGKITVTISLLILTVLTFGIFLRKTYADPASENVQLKNEYLSVIQDVKNEFHDNEKLKDGAIQMVDALQEAVENPDNAMDIDTRLCEAISCIYGILDQQNKTEENILEKIRDIAIKGNLREIRYIKFNAKLSGHVFDLPNPDVSKCKVK
jgi:hypothetical protein